MPTPEDPLAQLDAKTQVWRLRVFLATGFCYAGLYFCRKPFYIAKASLEEAWGWDAQMLGWLGLAYLVAYSAGQFLSAYTGTRFGPRRMLIVGMALSIVCNMVFGLTSALWVFAGFMVVNGFAQATGWPNVVGMMGTWFRRRERGTVMGVWGINYQLGSIGANGLAALLLGLSGIMGAFFGGAGVLLVVLAFFFFNGQNRPEDVGLPPLEDPAEPDEPADDDIGGWPREVVFNIALIGAFYFCVKFVRYALWSWTPYLLSTVYGMEADDAGYLSTVFDVAGIAGVLVCGFLSDRVFAGRRAGISLVFLVLMAAATALLYVLQPGDIRVFALFLGVIGFTLYGPDALMAGAGAIDVGSPKRAVAAAGIINGIGSIGSVLQEVVMGKLLTADSGVGPVFATLLGSSLVACVAMAWLVVRGRQGRAAV